MNCNLIQKSESGQPIGMAYCGGYVCGYALIGEPDLLVLDEPINGLDPQGILEVRQTIEALNRNRKTNCIYQTMTNHCTRKISFSLQALKEGLK